MQAFWSLQCQVPLHRLCHPLHGRFRPLRWRSHDKRFHRWPRHRGFGRQWHVYGHTDAPLGKYQRQGAAHVYRAYVSVLNGRFVLVKLLTDRRGLVFGTGIVCGPIVGGAFAVSSATWRWGFYLNLVVGGLFSPVYLFLLPPFEPRSGQNVGSKIREFDILGAILSIAILVCTIMAVNFGGALYTWQSGQIISLFVVAGVLLIAFVLQQKFVIMTQPSSRIFPLDFLFNKEAVLLFVLGCAANAGGYVPLYYIPLYFQFTRGNAALEAAVRLLPLVFLFSSAVIFNGALMSKYGLYQPWYVLGSILLIVGGALSCEYRIYPQ